MYPVLGRCPLPAARRPPPAKAQPYGFYGQREAGSVLFISRQILNTLPKFRADQIQL